MQFTAPKKTLVTLLSRVASVAPPKSTMPILSNVHLHAHHDVVTASATDLFLSVQASTPVDVRATGVVAVSPRELLERVKAMPDGSVTLTVTDGVSVSLKASGSKREFKLRGMRGEDYPPLAAPEAKAREVVLSPAAIRSLVDRTAYAISVDDTRPHLASALFEIGDGVARMVTTDGHRLSCAEVAHDGELPGLLLPRQAVTELRRLCTDDEPVKLLVSGHALFFVRENETLSVKQIDATFPPYRQVIPETVAARARVARAAALDSLRAVGVAASDRTGSVRLAFSPGRLRVFTENPDSGDACDELPIEYAGDEVTIGANVRYLVEVLAALDCDEVSLGVSGELDPVLVEAEGFRGVVMPMRI